MPDKYEAYTKAFGKRPDKVKPALAVKELDAELSDWQRKNYAKGWIGRTGGRQIHAALVPKGALKPAIEKAKQFIMDEILTSKGYYSSQLQMNLLLFFDNRIEKRRRTRAGFLTSPGLAFVVSLTP